MGNFKNSTCLLTIPKPYENDHTDTNSINSIAEVWGNGTPADPGQRATGYILSTDEHFRNITSFVGMAGTRAVNPNGISTRGLADGTIVTIHNPNNPVLRPSNENGRWIRVDGWRVASINNMRPRIIPRSEWGVREPTRLDPFTQEITTIVVHHTATGPTSNFGGGEWTYANRVRQIDYYHLHRAQPRTVNGVQVRGWAGGVGYHFLIAPDGTIFEGRPFDSIGTHAGNPAPSRNPFSIGIGLLGNFGLQQPTPPQTQINALYELIDYVRLRIPTIRNIESHYNSCPGPWFNNHF